MPTPNQMIAERFAKWFSEITGQSYTIIRGPDPPDFFMEPGSWLELTDIFLTNEQAKFENLRGGQSLALVVRPMNQQARLIRQLYGF